MSRYVLQPDSGSFELIPIDPSLKNLKVHIPDGLFVDMGVFNEVQEQDRMKWLLGRLSRTSISRTSIGQIKDGNVCLDFDYDKGLVSFCDRNFDNEYDAFYNLLKYNGIPL